MRERVIDCKKINVFFKGKQNIGIKKKQETNAMLFVNHRPVSFWFLHYSLFPWWCFGQSDWILWSQVVGMWRSWKERKPRLKWTAYLFVRKCLGVFPGNWYASWRGNAVGFLQLHQEQKVGNGWISWAFMITSDSVTFVKFKHALQVTVNPPEHNVLLFAITKQCHLRSVSFIFVLSHDVCEMNAFVHRAKS